MSGLLVRWAFRMVFMVMFFGPLMIGTVLPSSWKETTVFHAAVLVYVISSLFFIRWLTLRAIQHSPDGRNFWGAWWHAISDARVPLSFLPVIGTFFVSHREGDREL